MNNKRESYHPFAKFLHWTIVGLVAVQFVSGWLMPSLRHGGAVSYITITHISLGLLVPLVAALLFFMRFYKPVAKPEIEIMGLTKIITLGTHYMFYVLLVILPFSGWAAASIRGIKVSFLYFLNVPLLHMNGTSFVHGLAEVHSLLAALLGIVALGHIGAALYHHFVLKDAVLKRMLPKRMM